MPLNRLFTLPRILFFAVLIRLSLGILVWLVNGDGQPFFSPDSESYLAPARELAAHGTFTVNGNPEYIRTPGYPVLLLPGIWLGHEVLITLLLQALLGGVTVWLVYHLGMLVFQSKPAALWGAGWMAADPLSILYANKILTETLFAAAFTAFAFLLIRFLSDFRRWDAIGAALTLTVSIFVRPIGLYLPIPLTVLITLVLWRRAGLNKNRLISLALFVAIPLTLTGGWQARNIRVAQYHGFSGIEALSLYFYNGAALLAAKNHISYPEQQKLLGMADNGASSTLHPEAAAMPLPTRLEFFRREATHLILANPILYAPIHLNGMVLTLFGPGGTEILKMFGFFPPSSGLLNILVDKGVFQGVWEIFKNHPGLLIADGIAAPFLLAILVLTTLSCKYPDKRILLFFFLLALLGYLWIMSGGPAAYSRFRVPMMPLLCVFAGGGVAFLAKRFFKNNIT